MKNELTSLSASERKPPPNFYRWVVLLFVSLAMFGNYYVYDSISPLADVLKRQLHFSHSNIGLLNAIYSIPNILMVLVGGFIIDRIGTRRATLIFALLCLLGAGMTCWKGTLVFMAAGRLLFGLGAESLIVAVTTTLAKWFRGKELSFAFGINLTIARLGSFCALNSPSWAKQWYDYWQTPLLIATCFAGFCILGAVVYWGLEAAAEKRYRIGAAGETDKVIIGDLFKFGRSYWCIVALCITFYSGIFPFQTFAVEFFMETHGVTRETGGFLSSLLIGFAMVFTPLFGLMADRFGKRSLFMMFGSLLLIPVYLIMAYSHLSLYVPMAMMGIAFSLIPAIMWPSVAYMIEQSKLGTAYGLMTMIQNIGLAGFNQLIGWSNDISNAGASNPGGYAMGMWIFSSLGFFGFLFAFLLRKNETGPSAHGLETITTKAAAH